MPFGSPPLSPSRWPVRKCSGDEPTLNRVEEGGGKKKKTTYDHFWHRSDSCLPKAHKYADTKKVVYSTVHMDRRERKSFL